MKDVVLLYNPNAGGGERSPQDLMDQLRRHGYRPEGVALDEALRRMDPLDRGEFTIVAGGDGSVRRLATRLAHQGRTLTILPTGTANNIATSFGINRDLDEAIAAWKDAVVRPIDLGLAQGPWGRRHFIEGVGLGLIGRAIATMEMIDGASSRSFSHKEDKLYRDLCVLLTLAHEMPPLHIGVSQDGADRSGDYLLLEVLNISRAGPGFELARQSDPSDGCLQVVSVHADERAKLADSLKRCLGRLEHGTTLSSVRAEVMRLELTQGELRLDDDIIWPERGAPPRPEPATVELRIDPAALNFLLPAAT